MHKVNEKSRDLIVSWKKGWPDYIHMPAKDNVPIIQLAEQCAEVLKVDLDTEPGFKRVMTAIKNIAEFCSRKEDWRDKNLFSINQAIQTIMQQMIAEKKKEKELQEERTVAEKAYQYSRTEAGKREKMMEEQRMQAKKWYEEECTPEMQQEWEQFKKQLQAGNVVEMFPNKAKSM